MTTKNLQVVCGEIHVRIRMHAFLIVAQRFFSLNPLKYYSICDSLREETQYQKTEKQK